MGSRIARPSAGVVLNAAEALRGGQELFTAPQVAVLMALAYDAGRTARYTQDIADMHAGWARTQWRRTHEERVAAELAEMDRQARARAAREGREYRPHPGGPVDWETGLPVRSVREAA